MLWRPLEVLRSLQVQAEACGGLRLVHLPEAAAWQMAVLGRQMQALHIVVVPASAPACRLPLALAIHSLDQALRVGAAHHRAVAALGAARMRIFGGICTYEGAAWASQAPCGCLGFPM